MYNDADHFFYEKINEKIFDIEWDYDLVIWFYYL